MRKDNLILDNIYHVYNRGVEKRDIFNNDSDRLRFVKGLAIFNDKRPVTNSDIKFQDSESVLIQRESLVSILAFCLMPNHFHLLLKPLVDDGITKFMRKIGVGYANYFNLKYKRVGSLFQGRFKSVLISNESQYLYIPFYIHLNPLDLRFPDWRDKGIKEQKTAIKFLDNYKWSSHADYRGKSNFPFIVDKHILREYFGNDDSYSKEFYNFISDFDFSGMSEILLE